jgi:hypothetical protein
MNRLRVAYENAKPNVLARRKAQRNENEAKQKAARQAYQANQKRKANQHAAFLLTNAGKQWKRKANEEARYQEELERRANQHRRNLWAAGYSY